jgi:hypothetical protein
MSRPRRRADEALPLADAPALRRVVRRTRALRVALAVALVGLTLGGAQLARETHVERVSLLPSGTSGMLVLDLSASISTDTFARIQATLDSLARGKTPFGLVVFSDVAYEALPPGTPPAELAPFVRFFRIPKTAPGYAPSFPVNPWTRAFTGGTKISAGLAVARTVLGRAHVRHGAVLLVSDLSDAPTDLPRVAEEVVAYDRLHIPLRVVGLNPAPQDASYFRRLLQSHSDVLDARLPGEGEIRGQSEVSSSFPTGVVAAACALFLLLAANELAGARLAWRARRAPEPAPLGPDALSTGVPVREPVA